MKLGCTLPAENGGHKSLPYTYNRIAHFSKNFRKKSHCTQCKSDMSMCSFVADERSGVNKMMLRVDTAPHLQQWKLIQILQEEKTWAKFRPNLNI